MNSLLKVLLLVTPREEIEHTLIDMAEWKEKDKLDAINALGHSLTFNEEEYKELDRLAKDGLSPLLNKKHKLTSHIDVEIDLLSARVQIDTTPRQITCFYTMNLFVNNELVFKNTCQDKVFLGSEMEKICERILFDQGSGVIQTLRGFMFDRGKLFSIPNAAEIYVDLLELLPETSKRNYVHLKVFYIYMQNLLNTSEVRREDIDTLLQSWFTMTKSKKIKILYEDHDFLIMGHYKNEKKQHATIIDARSNHLKICESKDLQTVHQRHALSQQLVK